MNLKIIHDYKIMKWNDFTLKTEKKIVNSHKKFVIIIKLTSNNNWEYCIFVTSSPFSFCQNQKNMLKTL